MIVVYDIANDSPDVHLLVAGAVVLLALAASAYGRRSRSGAPHVEGATHRVVPRPVAVVGAVMIALCLLVLVASSLADQSRARDACARSACSTVEGPVTRFHAMPYSGHAMESFDVEGVHFAYSDYVAVPGLHRTVSHGGPIHDGMYVRLTYADLGGQRVIVRVETPR